MQLWIQAKHTLHHPIVDANDMVLDKTIAERLHKEHGLDISALPTAGDDSAEGTFKKAFEQGRTFTLKQAMSALVSNSKKLRAQFVEGRPPSADEIAKHRKLKLAIELATRWAEQRNIAEIADESIEIPVSKFARHVRAGLLHRDLQRERCVVDHIVHIIVAPAPPRLEGASAPPRIFSHSSTILGRLQSYSLHFVRPDEPSFERLVSQPIALTVPQMEEHAAESWQAHLRPDNLTRWSAVRQMYAHDFTTDKEFGEYVSLKRDETRWLAVVEAGVR